jgi:hypothetical protein
VGAATVGARHRWDELAPRIGALLGLPAAPSRVDTAEGAREAGWPPRREGPMDGWTASLRGHETGTARRGSPS